jgi:hypothetical protein
MARSPEELSRLAREFAALTPEERERVLAEANLRQKKFRPIPPGWKPPKLGGGGTWVGGSLRREELYGDDGR